MAEVSRTTSNRITTTRVEHFALLSPSGEVLGAYAPTLGGVQFYHKDLLGSVRAVTLNRTVMEARTYDAWRWPGAAGDTETTPGQRQRRSPH